MKWAIVGLFGLGVVAAIAAALLGVSLDAGGGGGGTDTENPDTPDPDVPVVVAASDLPAMTVLGPDAVTITMTKRKLAPVGSLPATIHAIGRVLRVDVKQGQVLSATDFHTQGSAAELAAALNEGERAVNVALSDSMGLEALLYPGSIVDVLVSMKLRSGEGGEQEPMTLTLLEGVRVLGVGQQTIVHQTEGEERAGRGPRPTVSLAVTAEQAEKLKLAMQEGSVSLTLRNPSDTTEVPTRITGLHALSPLLGGTQETLRAQTRERKVLVLKGGAAEVRTFDVTSQKN
jgi:pilus assembly protein CpaB